MKTEVTDQTLIIFPEGDVGKSQELNVNAISTLTQEQQVTRVIFDLCDCTIITSPGFGWIFGVARECKRLNISIATCNANDMVARSLKWVNGNLVMNICTTRAEAMAST